MSHDVQLKIGWVEHVGVRGNERVDSLAGKASITGALTTGRTDVPPAIRDNLIRCEATRSRLLGCGITYGTSGRDHKRRRIRHVANQCATGNNQHPHSSTSAGSDWAFVGLSRVK
ncbi:hypothetical protein BsWGS_09731 [Bradybaena similaris]